MIAMLVGGVGLFVLGMTMMTDGLKSAAGGAFRDLLRRFTGGPFQAFLSGAALTALVQSSSATLVMTIGFVSAGLLVFTQAIGVIFGAAVGTTSTGWLVAFLGLKYSVSVVALPLIGVGAFLRLLGRGRSAAIGMIVAGFGLIFVGIDTLQAGMATLSERVDLGSIPADHLLHRLLLVAVGIGMTVLMQSSSAAVATTLAALFAGQLGLEQAATLVIGQNIGTTVTAALASIGASSPARRTALAHILLNTFSGTIAFAMMPVYLRLMDWTATALGFGPAEQVALFHTSFNLLGVALLLPVTDRYGRLISRLVPDRSPPMTRHLDPSVLAVPSVAVEAARRTVVEICRTVLLAVRPAMVAGTLTRTERDLLEAAAAAIVRTREFLGRVRTSPDAEDYGRHLGVLHALDHAERLIDALSDLPEEGWLGLDTVLDEVAMMASNGLHSAEAWMSVGGPVEQVPQLEGLSVAIAEQRRAHRPRVMERTAAGMLSPDLGLRTLDAMRWLDRVVYHVWRATHHLGGVGGGRDREKFEDAPDPTGALSAPAPG